MTSDPSPNAAKAYRGTQGVCVGRAASCEVLGVWVTGFVVDFVSFRSHVPLSKIAFYFRFLRNAFIGCPKTFANSH